MTSSENVQVSADRRDLLLDNRWTVTATTLPGQIANGTLLAYAVCTV
ncbi:hypothetical protein [Streptomyces sp. HSG2]|nr:hypothetical protein [Streptomyces sp. HSG2]